MSTQPCTQPRAERPRKPRIAILFGGRSSEHAVSCSSAASVLRAIDREAYDVVPIGIARDGRWVLVPDDPQALELRREHVPEVDGSGDAIVAPLATTDRTLRALDQADVVRELGEVDVVFPVLHGPWGEDGTVQGMLDLPTSAMSAPACSRRRPAWTSTT
jgi:D-alanine-D-alanine ligase